MVNSKLQCKLCHIAMLVTMKTRASNSINIGKVSWLCAGYFLGTFEEFLNVAFQPMNDFHFHLIGQP